MSCQGCVDTVTRVLLGVPGVDSAEVGLAAGEARIRHDPGQASVAKLRTAIEDAGFDAD